MGTYIVQKGDTLSAIARQFRGDPEAWRDIATLNELANPNRLQIGQRLEIEGYEPPEAEGIPNPRPRPNITQVASPPERPIGVIPEDAQQMAMGGLEGMGRLNSDDGGWGEHAQMIRDMNQRTQQWDEDREASRTALNLGNVQEDFMNVPPAIAGAAIPEEEQLLQRDVGYQAPENTNQGYPGLSPEQLKVLTDRRPDIEKVLRAFTSEPTLIDEALEYFGLMQSAEPTGASLIPVMPWNWEKGTELPPGRTIRGPQRPTGGSGRRVGG